MEKSLAIIREGRGSHFDPDVLDAFFAIQDEILDIRLRVYSNVVDGQYGGVSYLEKLDLNILPVESRGGMIRP